MTSTMRHSYAQSIEEHYARAWGAAVVSYAEGGRSHELPLDFALLTMRRSPQMKAIATRCMSRPEDAVRLELHMLMPLASGFEPESAEILTAVAHYHHTGQRLDLGHTVNFGKPWVARSCCTHGLISLPYLDGPALEWLAEPRVRFLWLIPITAAEVAFKRTHGLDALEECFEREGVDYLDPGRPSVV
jgi:hypothetical protein